VYSVKCSKQFLVLNRIGPDPTRPANICKFSDPTKSDLTRGSTRSACNTDSENVIEPTFELSSFKYIESKWTAVASDRREIQWNKQTSRQDMLQRNYRHSFCLTMYLQQSVNNHLTWSSYVSPIEILWSIVMPISLVKSIMLRPTPGLRWQGVSEDQMMSLTASDS